MTGRYGLRNSCDYFPDEPDSHRYHIFTNLVNAMFTSQLNLVPDFDMVGGENALSHRKTHWGPKLTLSQFQSHSYIRPQGNRDQLPREVSIDDYPQTAFHAALRAFGSGPVTLIDVAERTYPKIVGRLIGHGLGQLTPSLSPPLVGRSVALHASRSPFVSDDVFDASLLHSGLGQPLKVFSRRGEDGMEGCLIGYWNSRAGNGVVEDQLTIDDVMTLIGGQLEI
ncbi:hypothetical protein FRB96_005229 [Tulasnella sp. 330]|nr:hypothetical protein FRB96_005229 [Tulasnella sp. 330]